MKNLILSALLSLASFFGYQQPQPVHLGAFSPVQGTQFYLSGAGITSTANTIQLTSFQTPDGRNLTMSMFGSTGYAALEPGTSKLEDVTFTGITQNGNGTATLTGVTRGNDFVTPYAASTTLAKAHSGGATFILSNTAGFYGGEFALLNSNQTITGQWTFNNFPLTPSTSTSTVNVAGVNQFATPAQQAASAATSTNGTNAPLSLSSQYATSTWNSASLAANRTVIAGSLGKIDPNFIFNVTTLWPSNNGVSSSSVLSNDASGNLSWLLPTSRVFSLPSNQTSNSPSASTTLTSVTIPANTLSLSKQLRVTTSFTANNAAGSCTFSIDFGNGSATTSIGWANDTALKTSQILAVMSATTTSSEMWNSVNTGGAVGVGGSFTAVTPLVGRAYMTTDLTAKTFLAFTSNSSSNQCSVDSYSLEVLTSP